MRGLLYMEMLYLNIFDRLFFISIYKNCIMVGTASLYIVDAEILVLRGMSATSETKIIGFKTEHCPF